MTQIRLTYKRVDSWPPLAWLAACHASSGCAHILIGRNVEAFPDWFCEAAWTGDFAAGDFDRDEIVVGSGGRCRQDQIRFVTAASTVDRLYSQPVHGGFLVSNSLPCLLNAAGSALRPSYPFYNRVLHSITKGLRNYQRLIDTTAGQVQLTYFDNLVWDGQSLRVEPRIDQAPKFNSFRQYSEYLEEHLRCLAKNASSTHREQPQFRLLTTLSTGYDSAAVSAVAARCGCRKALSFDSANNGLPDSGAEIAKALGLDLILVSRGAWRQRDRIDAPVFASGQIGAVIFAGAEEHLRGTVLLTGFSGDTVWNLKHGGLGSEILRGDTSGLGLTEYRLWAGFLHCPLPFWGARHAAQIGAISNSEEMSNYVIHGTDYNRPICRRIVEEAGVGRDQFGREKKAAEPYAWYDREFMTPGSYQDYCEWVRLNRKDWLRRGRLPPWRSIPGDALINKCSSTAAGVVRSCGKTLARFCQLMPGLETIEFKQLTMIHPPLLNLRRYWFPWAVDRVKERYLAVTRAQIERLMNRASD
jgi:hypothetical protein